MSATNQQPAHAPAPAGHQPAVRPDPTYEPPRITPLVTGATNKYGGSASPGLRVREDIEGVAVADLIREHGSPLFVFSESTMRQAWQRLYNALTAGWDDVVLAWSYKTNPLAAVCQIFHQQGSLAEVVSDLEYHKARQLGVPGEQIIFNGPVKSRAMLQQAVDEGAVIHADHLDELDDLLAIASDRGQPIPIGLRINLDAGIAPQWSRFGFNLESGQAMAAVERMHRSGLLRLTGLHCHLGTFITEPEAYARAVGKLAAFAREVETRYGERIDSLDLGGGLPSHSRLKGSYLAPDVALAPIERYAEAITGALRLHFPGDHRPRLIMEPGRALIDEAGFLITSVLARKRLATGTPAYVADAGVNLLYTSTWYRFRIEPAVAVHGTPEASVIHGPLCMNIDVVDDGISLPPLPRGTPLVVSPVGAYNLAQSMQFIHARPAAVLITSTGRVETIRAAEDLDAVCISERLPEHLR